jgi:hypothetical protein
VRLNGRRLDSESATRLFHIFPIAFVSLSLDAFGDLGIVAGAPSTWGVVIFHPVCVYSASQLAGTVLSEPMLANSHAVGRRSQPLGLATTEARTT